MGELEIIIIVIIFSVILIFCICAYCNGRDKTKSGSGERNKPKSEWNYKATKELYNFCIDENARVWWNKNTLGTPQVHSFDDVLDFELVVDDNKTKGKNAIGRAVAGGLLFGGAGAVIGANTAKQVQVVSSLYINVYLKGGGFEKLVYLQGNFKADSFVYNVALQNAQESIAMLTSMVSEKETEKSGNSEVDNAEAIAKYKKLLDEGAITQEEYDAKKKQLLNL